MFNNILYKYVCSRYILKNFSNFLSMSVLKLKSKSTFLIFFSFLLSIIFIFIPSNISFAGLFDNTPELVTTLNDAFEDIERWLLTLATPAAAVAVGVGVFMKKFSFGDEERIRIAKRLIRGSLFSYAFILAINLILSAIQSLIS